MFATTFVRWQKSRQNIRHVHRKQKEENKIEVCDIASPVASENSDQKQQTYFTPPKFDYSPWKMMVGTLLFFLWQTAYFQGRNVQFSRPCIFFQFGNDPETRSGIAGNRTHRRTIVGTSFSTSACWAQLEAGRKLRFCWFLALDTWNFPQGTFP